MNMINKTFTTLIIYIIFLYSMGSFMFSEITMKGKGFKHIDYFHRVFSPVWPLSWLWRWLCRAKALPHWLKQYYKLIVSHARMAEPPPRQGINTQQSSEAKDHYPGQNLSGSWLIPVQATLTAQPTCSSWSGDSGSYIHHGMACGSPYNSLEQNKRLLERTCKLLPIGAPN